MTYMEFIIGVENNIAKANCNKLNIGEYEEKQKQIYKQIRADAIDDFKDDLIKLIRLREESHFYDISEHDYEWLISDIMYSAKKLKEKIEKEQNK